MLPITPALSGNFPFVNVLSGVNEVMNSVSPVSSTLTRLRNSVLRRPSKETSDDAFDSKRTGSSKTVAPTLTDMPELVLKFIIGYIRPEDIVPLTAVFNPQQKVYFSREINYGRIVRDSLSWVNSIRDFDMALAKIQALTAKQRALPLIRLGGHVYEMKPEDRPIAMALYAAEARLHYESTPHLAHKLRAVQDATSFCRLLAGEVTAERGLRDIAAMYAVTSPSGLQELERLIVNTMAGRGGWAGKNARDVAAKFGINDKESTALLEQYIFTEVYRSQINETATCGDIAERYGIYSPSGREQLEKYRVKQSIGMEAQSGRNCVFLAHRYEIITAAARECLEHYAAEGDMGAEAQSGGNCLMLAEKYGISTPVVRNLIENISIRNRLWGMAHAGYNCHDLATLYGIVTPEGRTLLEGYAVMGIAKAEVQFGKHCDVVAKKYGITSHIARSALEIHAVGGLAGANARHGMDCNRLASQYGIFSRNARIALEKCSLESLIARKCNMKRDCQQIADKYGIITDEVRAALENHVVNTRGKREIRYGNDCHDIAKKLSLKTVAARLTLELSTIEHIFGAKTEGRLNARKIRDKYQITHPTAVKMLELSLIKSEYVREEIHAGQHWWDIAGKYGITMMACLDELQLNCVNAIAGNALGIGGNCHTLAARFGVIAPTARIALEEQYLDRAMADIRTGGNYRVIAARYGINSTPVLNKLIKQYVLYQYGNDRPIPETQQNGAAV